MKTADITFGKKNEYQARVYTPYDPVGVVLYLHGLGEVGGAMEQVEKNEIPKLLKDGLVVDYIVIAPHLMKGSNWPIALLEQACYYIDKLGCVASNIHVTGLSMGGMGCFRTVKMIYDTRGITNYFKTVGVVSGRSDYKTLGVYLTTPFIGQPIKMWHGVDDGTIKIASARSTAKYINLAGGNVVLIEYPGVGHSAWHQAYRPGAVEGYFDWIQ